MKNKIIKYTSFAIIIIIIVLAFANPSLKQFKEYIGERSWSPYILTYERKTNWLIYSTYEVSYIKNDLFEPDDEDKVGLLNDIKGTYSGFFLNFYKKYK